MSNEITRKEFLSSTSKYALGAVTGAAALGAISGGTLFAEPKAAVWPWPYQTIDPEDVRLRAHHLYYSDKDCASGVFGSFTEALKEKLPDPWANMPMEVMLFGRGGGNGWGTLCGAVNGAAAIISLVVSKADSGKLINEVWGWAAAEKLPSDKANQASIDGKYADKKYVGALPQNIAGTVICHASVSQWCNVAKKGVGDTERKERCARLAGDVAAKTAQVLNDYFATKFVSTYVTNPNVTQCQTCHGTTGTNNVMTQMDCQPCHSTAHKTSSAVGGLGAAAATEFTLGQNYPNPFNPATNIEFSVPKSEKVSVVIYDIQGREVKKLVDQESFEAGSYSVEWNGTDNSGGNVVSGIYFARMNAGQFVQTRKMNLIK
ncbi:MAG: C-GCAxxG-C-C family (seleno)protein [Acidobacteriota bacterium]